MHHEKQEASRFFCLSFLSILTVTRRLSTHNSIFDLYHLIHLLFTSFFLYTIDKTGDYNMKVNFVSNQLIYGWCLSISGSSWKTCHKIKFLIGKFIKINEPLNWLHRLAMHFSAVFATCRFENKHSFSQMRSGPKPTTTNWKFFYESLRNWCWTILKVTLKCLIKFAKISTKTARHR